MLWKPLFLGMRQFHFLPESSRELLLFAFIYFILFYFFPQTEKKSEILLVQSKLQ